MCYGTTMCCGKKPDPNQNYRFSDFFWWEWILCVNPPDQERAVVILRDDFTRAK